MNCAMNPMNFSPDQYYGETALFHGESVPRPHGFGRRLFYRRNEHGCVYKGSIMSTWERGCPDGSCIYHDATGDVYTGQVKGGQRCGAGVYVYNDETSIVGYWKDNRPHGIGLQKDADGELALLLGGKLWKRIVYNDQDKGPDDLPRMELVNIFPTP
tara:strand:+ start:924 stop:1394 length:471 start_codon:yes stop_codon:yes gene_type:complete